jgi:hypothetical protein
MTTTNGIPLPAGTSSAGDWDWVYNEHERHRFFFGTQRGVAGITANYDVAPERNRFPFPLATV